MDKRYEPRRKNYNARYYLIHKERVKAKNRKWEKANRARVNLRRAQRRRAFTEDKFGIKYPKEALCGICGKLVSGIHLVLDHDHKTGKFRGWLCQGCNLYLGYYETHKEDILRYL